MSRNEILLAILVIVTIVLVVKGAETDFIPIAADQHESYRVVMTQFELLQKSLELIRLQSCWEAGVKPEECGQFDHQRGVILRVKPKEPHAP